MLRRGIDIRYVVTSLQGSEAGHIYETIYCARGQAENLIKQHKAQLSSDRCRSPLANQMRLILHTGAYWLLLDLRAAIPSWNPLRHTEFATIRLRLLKIASRIIEHASRIWTISQRGDDARRAPIHSSPSPESLARSWRAALRRFWQRGFSAWLEANPGGSPSTSSRFR